jgi:hypothetical protein
MRFNYLAGACLASAFLLGACSGESGALPTSTMVLPSALQTHVDDSVGPTACAKAKIYVADFAKSNVEFYPQGVSNPRPCGKITTGVSAPEAIYVDAKGTLYVANFSPSTVTEYLAGKKTPSFTITTLAPGYDLFVGSDKTLYVAEATANTVAEYAPGATTPTLSLSINGGPHGVATDKHNNLYVSYLSDSDGVSHVEKFAPKATTGKDLGFTVSFSGEVKLDLNDDVVLGDRNNNDIVYIYPPGQTVPSRSFATPGGNPINFALNKAETLFYVSGFTQVQVINFQTGVQVDNITHGLTSPSGVAAYPPAPY